MVKAKSSVHDKDVQTEILNGIVRLLYLPEGWPEPDWGEVERGWSALMLEMGIEVTGRKHDEGWLIPVIRLARRALEGEPVAVSGYRVGLEKGRIIYRCGDWRAAFYVFLWRLVDLVGADQIKRCPLEGCGRLFIPVRRQLACTLAHAQRIRRQRWEKKQ
jgi:hypothetical protein